MALYISAHQTFMVRSAFHLVICIVISTYNYLLLPAREVNRVLFQTLGISLCHLKKDVFHCRSGCQIQIVHSQYLNFIAAGLNQVIIFRHQKQVCFYPCENMVVSIFWFFLIKGDLSLRFCRDFCVMFLLCRDEM